MPSLGRIRHFDLPGQDRFPGVSPVKAEIMSLGGPFDVFLDRGSVKGQLGIIVEVFGYPARYLCGECSFVYWHFQNSS